MQMKKCLIYILISLFLASYSIVFSQGTTRADDTSVQARINLLTERMKDYDLRWQKVSDYLDLSDHYKNLNRLAESKKALKNAYKEKDLIVSKRLDSNDCVGTFIVLIHYNRVHKKWDKTYELSKALIEYIDNKQISNAPLVGYSYPGFCSNAAKALLSMNKPEAAMKYVEKGLAWSGESYYKDSTSREFQLVKKSKIYVLQVQAEIYQKAYHDNQKAKQIYHEILSTYSEITDPNSIYKTTLPDENDKFKDAQIVVKENLEKLK
jgi:hypothetical protein